MDKECTKKLTESIKKKLKEFQGNVVAGLPDYILILVANKKTEAQMTQDLKVFLGSNTAEFTKWLINLLHEMKPVKEDKTKSEPELPNDAHADRDEDILKLTAQEQDDYELIPREEELSTEEVVKSSEAFIVSESKELPIDKIIKPSETLILSEEVEEHQNIEKHVSVNIGTDPTLKKSSKPKSKIISSIAKVKIERGRDEYDPCFPSYVHSKIQTIPRKSSVPVNMQANKLLLLKAIDDANASVIGKDNMDKIYHPTPIKVLVAEECQKTPSVASRTNNKFSMTCDMSNDADDDGDNNSWTDEVLVTVSNHQSEAYSPASDPIFVNAYNHREVIINSPGKVQKFSYDYNDELSESDDDRYIPRAVEPRAVEFVVTLDGMPNELKTKRSFSDMVVKMQSNNSEEEACDKSPEKIVIEENQSSVKKQKLMERCRFWPACKNNDNCEYHHPSVPCKLFPNCKYGDDCLYIHPTCKFDSRCTRKDCPYTHLAKRDFSVPNLGFNIANLNASFTPSTPFCKFYPNCSVYPCPFLHQKKCKFGTKCNTPNCQFLHNFPPRYQLKWKAQSSP